MRGRLAGLAAALLWPLSAAASEAKEIGKLLELARAAGQLLLFVSMVAYAGLMLFLSRVRTGKAVSVFLLSFLSLAYVALQALSLLLIHEEKSKQGLMTLSAGVGLVVLLFSLGSRAWRREPQ
jgi:cytochrome bd-type quinol oxidase subunit 2